MNHKFKGARRLDSRRLPHGREKNPGGGVQPGRQGERGESGEGYQSAVSEADGKDEGTQPVDCHGTGRQEADGCEAPALGDGDETQPEQVDSSLGDGEESPGEEIATGDGVEALPEPEEKPVDGDEALNETGEGKQGDGEESAEQHVATGDGSEAEQGDGDGGIPGQSVAGSGGEEEPDIEAMLAEAERRGYLRGRNENIRGLMGEAPQVPTTPDTPLTSEPDDIPILNHTRRNWWE